MLGVQLSDVKTQMFLDEARNKVITVVVTGMCAEYQGQAALFAGRLQQLGFQLFRKIGIVSTLIDQNTLVMRNIAGISGLPRKNRIPSR